MMVMTMVPTTVFSARKAVQTHACLPGGVASPVLLIGGWIWRGPNRIRRGRDLFVSDRGSTSYWLYTTGQQTT